ncbi:MAG: 4'-phosphopantetheinyl transferase superfamily protein, partial [Bacteroidota bacterium]
MFALRQDRSETRVKRYLEKITTPEERSLLKTLPPALQLAYAWSLKEAAYKYWRRIRRLSANPKTLVIRAMHLVAGATFPPTVPLAENGFEGFIHRVAIVETVFGRMPCKSIVTDCFVHSVLSHSDELLEKVSWGIVQVDAPTYHEQTNAVRSQAIRHFARVNQRENDQYQFAKNANHA